VKSFTALHARGPPGAVGEVASVARPSVAEPRPEVAQRTPLGPPQGGPHPNPPLPLAARCGLPPDAI